MRVTLERSVPFFFSCNGARKRAYSEEARYGTHTGVGYSSHSGRRTFATRLIANGHSLETVQTLLGHTHIDHVAPYLELSQREFREAVAAVNLSG
ncbi:tyrosine-type recombinase/integrase [Paraburkholderia sp. J11-2]|uniref:tyrosine-type recombinase/integrase n=1 Tax=Paraburkholderia sp. J11-2 TaxID=2805431 RepID=UPI002AB66455|nr:tyrosine-type recombinase/integrase [Paraburkholderia sp. J11-2]